MLRHTGRSLFFLGLIVAFMCGGAWAQQPQDKLPTNTPAGQKPIYKVKPAQPEILKVKPSFDFRGISRFNPLEWGLDCCLPTPARRQFVAGPRVWFARIQGQISKGGTYFFGEPSVVDFDDHLGISKSNNVVWSVMAHYQIMPRWGIHYSFTPFTTEATSQGTETFTFRGITFTTGTTLRSKWERYEHRAGLVYDISRAPNSVTSLFADWWYIQDKITMRQALGGLNAVSWDTDKNLAVLGLEMNKCLKNFRGNTLAISCKAGIAFLDDHNGYELEAGLSYLIPIKRGRFGFLKGGYRYAQLKKDKDYELFNTRMDGAFVEAGFIF